MLRILHITECYDGGVSRAVDRVVALRPEDEHYILYDGSEQPGQRARYTTETRFERGFLSRVIQVARMIDTVRPDIVHAHSSWAGVYARIVRTRSDRTIYQPHCYAFESPAKPWIARTIFFWAEKILSRATAVTIVLSEHEAKLAQRINRFVPAVFVPNVPSWTGRVERGRQAQAPNRVIMVGRVCSQKDPEFFIALGRAVRELRPGTQFVWVGDGEPLFKRQLADADIRVTGWLDEPDLYEEMRSSDLYLHSASYEGFPLSVLDAASLGLPILVRLIPAFEGSDLDGAVSVADLASKVAEALDDAHYRESLVERSASLLESMSEDKQREAISRAYGLAMGVAQ